MAASGLCYDRVKVAVRVRPRVHSEIQRDDNVVVTADEEECVVSVTGAVNDKDRDFSADYVFGPSSTQLDVFDSCVQPLVDGCFEGFDACLFAYGQTGSGKTFTMLGDGGGLDGAALDGIIPLTVRALFQRLKKEEEEAVEVAGSRVSQYEVRVSYVEIYSDKVRDLLRPGEESKWLAIREDKDGGTFLQGSVEEIVRSPAELAAIVRRASRRRATDKTGMNPHSSRSHAVCTVALEHRWRDPASSSNKVKARVARFDLVDLAGSERAKKTSNTAQQLQESASINSSLLVLGNVIAALSGKGDRHVPFRNSALTRLLQRSLGGDGRVLMMACVSPVEYNVSETVNTLRYAATARAVATAPVSRVTDVEAVGHPLDGDTADPDAALDRRCVWLTTSFGRLFARCVGRPEDELILLIHGSGPRNSSAWWNELVHEVAVRAEGEALPHLRSFYMVAIDCPGYGRSEGIRQAVRSNPGDLVAAVLAALGRASAFALVGSSQGAASTFNAVLERPNLCKYIVVRDPVGHDVFRYKAITQPSLLIFEIEDDGHPVKVGRWMRDALPTPHYFEFSSRTHPTWHSDRMALEMLNMFRDHEMASPPPPPRSHSKHATKHATGEVPSNPHGSSTEVGSGPSLFERGEEGTGVAAAVRLAGGLCMWAEGRGQERGPKSIVGGTLPAPSLVLAALRRACAAVRAAVAPPLEQWRSQVCPRTGRVLYISPAGTRTWARPRGVEVLPPPDREETGAVAADMFADSDDGDDGGETQDEIDARMAQELAQTACDHCRQLLCMPVRLPACRHVFCQPCYVEVAWGTGACPVCQEDVPDTRLPVDGVLGDRAAAAAGEAAAAARAAEVQQWRARRGQRARVVLEYGNSAKKGAKDGGGGGVHEVQAFVRVVRVEKGKACKKALPSKASVIKRVEFNINPRYPKSAVKVTQSPFELTRTMATRFPCDMKVVWGFSSPSAGKCVDIPYTIQHDRPLHKRRLVVTID